ncbi:hypothetical protein TWF694_009268 [Orbilia ellipsospora]|uniref:tRNA wybutosine-synthesizing protein 2 n=1 Tax=Orbilia ellipsospora TaxID=2528407 RepID=A0AAV9XFU8_9PEZI
MQTTNHHDEDHHQHHDDKPPRGKKPPKQHASFTALTSFVSSHPPSTPSPPPSIPSKLRYDLYGTFLLLPPTTPLSTPSWTTYISTLPSKDQELLYSTLASVLNATHIAINAPIPAKQTADGNLIRAPKITPLHGDFGDVNSTDFDGVFWASTVQHGIYQTWCPLHTMFSRGNITEKQRLYELVSSQLSSPTSSPDVPTQVGGRGRRKRKVAAVDLFVGIGYFAFSYLKAGVDAVYGWDINTWSTEGCKRGAIANKWPVSMPSRGESGDVDEPEPRLVIFEESNVYAVERIQWLKGCIKREGKEWPHIMHVNLGLLPTSSAAYGIAIEILKSNDRREEAWVHVHENVAKEDVEVMKGSILERVGVLVGDSGMVNCDHVEFVKSWAPGVWHCVFDIRITPL